jgi:polyhydroxyalkanoate synthesis repressor PhaR
MSNMADNEKGAEVAAEAVAEAPHEPKVIKRYTNRKLYDTVESRYVTLEEIGEMIKNGAEVKIVDNRTKEDLTAVTLAQIIFEEEKKKSRLPLGTLRDMIRSSQVAVTDFVSTRAGAIREEVEARMGRLLKRGEVPGSGGAPGAAAGGADAAQTQAQKERASVKDIIAASQRAIEEFQKRVDERVKHAVSRNGSRRWRKSWTI